MKKVLFICLLAVFTFSLAGSASAAVTNASITIPADQELNYQTTKAITWTYTGGVTAPKFNISMVSQATPATELPIAQVLCRAPGVDDPCTFSWKVGSLKSGRFLMGVNYKIRVCRAGADPTDLTECDDSPTDFTIIPPELKTQQQVFDLFKTAIGNRYNDLDKNNNSGLAGVRDFITVNTAAADEAPAYRISKDMVNQAKAYKLTGKDLLDWFKDKFTSTPSGAFLNERDRSGITYAMTNRYKDLCANKFNSDVNNIKVYYNIATAKAEKAKQAAIKVCNDTYKVSIAEVKNMAEPNLFIKAIQQFIAKEKARLIKDSCVNMAYNSYYNNAKTHATPGVLALQVKLEFDDYPVKKTNYTDCLSDVDDLTWQYTN